MTTVIENPVHEWEIPAYNREAFAKKIEQANGKLARAGLDARFEVTYTDFTKTRKNNSPLLPDGTYAKDDLLAVQEPWVRVTLDGPLRLSAGHFTFVASLVPEEGGITVHSAPGQELGGYAPRGDNNCDYCDVSRARTRLYLVRDERDGSILQLGHNCIELFTGVSPKGLWALTFNEELEVFTRESEGGFAVRDLGTSIDTVIAYAWVHSNEGRAYVPTSSEFSTPTVSLVRTSLFESIHAIKHAETRKYFLDAADRAAEVETDLIEAIKASVETVSADSDYGRNLRVILAGENVSGRNLGILASLAKVYAKQQQIEAERKASPVAKGFIGEVKERIRNFEIKLTTAQEFDGDYGVKTLFVGRTPTGHVVKWWASNAYRYEVGDTLYLAAATVKAHENYKGTDQTVITRGKIDSEKAQEVLRAKD